MKITQREMRMRVVMLVLTIAAAEASAVVTTNTSLPGCPTECGGVSIPYPFGIGDGCFRPGFEVRCNKTVNGSTILYTPLIETLTGDDRQVIRITQSPAQVRIYNGISSDCFYSNGSIVDNSQVYRPLVVGDPYRISDARNKLTAVGCNIIAYLEYFQNEFMSGCLSICNSLVNKIVDGLCSGVGCCQISIPEDFDFYGVALRPTNEEYFFNSSTQDFSCSFAFLADQEGYQFKASDTNITNADFGYDGLMPMTLDWAIRNDTGCEEAHRNNLGTNSSYACLSEHSECIDSTNGAGYTCNCSAGYQGNPYLQGGCQDINECDFPDKYPCYGICTNMPGNYSCSCPAGHQGNPYLRGGGCYPQGWGVGKIFIAGTCVAIGILLLLLTGALLWKMLKKRRVRRRKDKFYRQNRGLLLQQLISSDEALVERLKIFDLEELEKATNNFSSSRVVGGGGHGTVYKGILSDQRVVAIKKSKIVVQSEIDQFINEVVILSQINHRHVVKLFGCCLESQVPLLVYEFISGGTLFNLLHSVDKITAISFDDRLRIAREIAGALAYLHSAASISIFHRDVKTSNVLINENYTAKVSDFGASRSLPPNQTRVTTAVQGTFGYLDPEYYQTGQLTEKSDVYSFGVILVELLTRQLPVSRGRLEELEGNLSKRFIDSFRKGSLFRILDPQVLAEGSKEEIEEIACIADMCLRLKGEERPTMKEVERRLDSMRNFGKQNYDPGALLEHGSSTDMQRDVSIEDNATTSSTRQYSLQQEFLLTLELPR